MAYIEEGGSIVTGLLNELAKSRLEPLDGPTLPQLREARMTFYDAYPINCWQLALLLALDERPDFLGAVNRQIAATTVRPATPSARRLQAGHPCAHALTMSIERGFERRAASQSAQSTGDSPDGPNRGPPMSDVNERQLTAARL